MINQFPKNNFISYFKLNLIKYLRIIIQIEYKEMKKIIY